MGQSSTGTLRCFVALDFPPGATAPLVDVMHRLGRHRAQVRWVDAERLHLTLAFLGDVPAARVPAVAAALRSLAGMAAFELRLEGLGAFPEHGPPRVLWAGLGGDIAALRALVAAVQVCLGPLGFEPEERELRPHATIGRVKGERGLGDVLRELRQAGAELRGEPMRVDRVRLYRSTLTPEGPVYEMLEEVAF